MVYLSYIHEFILKHAGNAEAQYSLGMKYSTGDETSKNLKYAFSLFQKASDQGDKRAQYELARCYQQGIGVEKDLKKAIEYYQQAAKKDHIEAQFELGWIYETGQGVVKNDRQAFKWYQRAAINGKLEALYFLGLMYAEGQGVVRNDKIACGCFRYAANLQHRNAQYQLGLMYESGRAFNEKQEPVPINYDLAFQWYNAAAKSDHIISLYKLGTMYEYGLGTYQDDALAWKKYEEAQALAESANQIHPEIEFSLGKLCAQNRVPREAAKSLNKYEYTCNRFQKAASQGHALAQLYLGWMYEKSGSFFNSGDTEKAGECYLKAMLEYDGFLFLENFRDRDKHIKEDKEILAVIMAACHWYEKRAKEGHSDAQYIIGKTYAKGLGVQQDNKIATEWYQRSIESGNNINAKFELALAFFNGQGKPQDNTSAFHLFKDIADTAFMATDKAKAKTKTTSNIVYPAAVISAIVRCADAYYYGLGVDKDLMKAFEYYQKAATIGNLQAIYKIGTFYEDGNVVTKDEARACQLYQKAAEGGCIEAQSNLGKMYAYGRGVQRNNDLAFDWTYKAAIRGHTKAQCNLGVMYEEGIGVIQDFKLAIYWYQRATEQNLPDAQCYLGMLYYKGRGIEKDIKKGIEWYQLAAKNGFLEAQNALAAHEAKHAKELADAKNTPKVLDGKQKVILFSINKPKVDFERKGLLEKPETISLDVINYNDITFKKEEQDLGKGHFGSVKKGKWRFCDVAVKKLFIENPSEEALAEFIKEYKIMAQLRCPNIVGFYGYTLKPYCIVMEYLPFSLFRILHNPQITLDWSTRIRIARHIAIGLAFLHKQDIIHRDIKSDNVLLTQDYAAKLTDFGLSKIKTASRETIQISGDKAGGTFQWMAPEILNNIISKASDIYSMGITFWELASRETPFKNIERRELIPFFVLSMGLKEHIPADCPKKLATLIQSCWDKEPKARPTADEVVTYLDVEEAENFPVFLQFYRSKLAADEIKIVAENKQNSVENKNNMTENKTQNGNNLTENKMQNENNDYPDNLDSSPSNNVNGQEKQQNELDQNVQDSSASLQISRGKRSYA